MAALFEESLICKLLDAPDLEMLHSNGVTEDMFLTRKEEIKFIISHYHSYKQMPDKLTFLGQFKDFQLLEVTESTDYLIYKLKEAYSYTKIVPIIQSAADLVREDSIKAVEYLKSQLEEFQKNVPISKNKDGYDIISNAKDRLAEYKKRCEVKGLIGIPTGIDKLDEITNGWLWGEELVVITGRTNVGKTWIGEYFATVAWNMGYKILFYSGEMSRERVGFRFDAYQGFAKQNYTMLDNLKLGYGGTKEEMARLLTDATKLTGVQYDIDNLSDVYNAIHAIQGNLGITGTTAKEASVTFAGSFASMKAAAQNLLGNLAIGGDVTSSMEQLVDTATTFLFDNAIPMIGRIFEGLPDAIGVAIEKGAPKLKQLGGTIVSSIKDGLKTALPSELGALVDPAFEGMGNAIKGSIDAAKNIMQGLVPVVTNVITTLAPVVGQIGDMFNRVAPVVQDALSSAFGESGGFIEGFAGIVSSAIPVVEQVINSLAQVFKAVIPAIQPILTTLGTLIQTLFPVIQNIIATFGNIVSTVFPLVANVISTALNAVMPIINALATVIQTALPIVQNVISTVAGVIQAVMPTISQIFSQVGAKIAEVINTVVVPVMGVLQQIFQTVSPILQSCIEIVAQVFSTAWGIISPIIDLAMSVFNALWGVVEAVFPAIQSTIEAVWGVLEPIFGAIANGLSIVGDAISGVADFVGSGIDTIAGWFGFAYGKDRVPYDNYPAMLHQGEKVLTRNQADQYDRTMSTRGVQLTKSVQPLEREDGSKTPTGDIGISQDTPKESKGGTTVNIEKLADTVVIEKEADVDKVVEDMVKKFRKLVPNMP